MNYFKSFNKMPGEFILCINSTTHYQQTHLSCCQGTEKEIERQLYSREIEKRDQKHDKVCKAKTLILA